MRGIFPDKNNRDAVVASPGLFPHAPNMISQVRGIMSLGDNFLKPYPNLRVFIQGKKHNTKGRNDLLLVISSDQPYKAVGKLKF